MEINAEVYAIALTEELLRQVCRQLSKKTFQSRCYPEALEPCSVLPITRTWYASTMRAEPTDGPEGWMSCLRECGRILGMNGAVVVEYSSPDAPDSYQEYAYTTPGGDAGHSERLARIIPSSSATVCGRSSSRKASHISEMGPSWTVHP